MNDIPRSEGDPIEVHILSLILLSKGFVGIYLSILLHSILLVRTLQVLHSLSHYRIGGA